MKLAAQNLSFSYPGKPLFDHVSLEFSSGSFTALLGPNGGGKSSLLKLLSGVLSPQRGEILLDGQKLSGFSGTERARHLAVVPQNPSPALDFSVREFVTIGRNARKRVFEGLNASDLEAVEQALALLELTGLAEKRCSTLSGGEFQRCVIAQALAQQTPVLLLDEPTGALDPGHAVSVLQRLVTLPHCPTIVMVSHDPAMAACFADRLIFLKNGAIAADGAPEETMTQDRLTAIYGTPVEILHQNDKFFLAFG